MIKVQREDFDVGAELAALIAGRTDVGGVASFIGLVRDRASDATVGALTLEQTFSSAGLPAQTSSSSREISANASATSSQGKDGPSRDDLRP